MVGGYKKAWEFFVVAAVVKGHVILSSLEVVLKKQFLKRVTGQNKVEASCKGFVEDWSCKWSSVGINKLAKIWRGLSRFSVGETLK